MKTYYQLNIFSEKEILTPKSKSYENFLKKFEPRKTTDDCYTPAAVYNAVLEYVNEYIVKLSGSRILRPFKPGGDYLAEKYDDKTIVIDNPPFSVYSKIVRNYLRMNVKFFLFAPALSLFVLNTDCQYIITNCNIIYENGAKVRTSFATNLLQEGVKICLSGVLSEAIKAAQKQNKKTLKKMQMPDGYFSSAQLLKFVPDFEHEYNLQGSNDFLTKIDGHKIFGSAMRMTTKDINHLNSYKSILNI